MDYEDIRPHDEYIHIDDLPTSQTQDYLEGIKEALYDSGDVQKLEHCLEELCALYDVSFPNKRPILSSLEHKNMVLSRHIDRQIEYVDKLMGRKS